MSELLSREFLNVVSRIGEYSQFRDPGDERTKPLHGGGSRSRRDGRRPFSFRDFCWRRLVRSGMPEFDPSAPASHSLS